jgi:hypothetical protein
MGVVATLHNPTFVVLLVVVAALSAVSWFRHR